MDCNGLIDVLGDWLKKYENFPSLPHTSQEFYHEWEDSMMDIIAHLDTVNELRGTPVEMELKETVQIAKDHNHHLITEIFRHILIVRDYLESEHPCNPPSA